MRFGKLLITSVLLSSTLYASQDQSLTELLNPSRGILNQEVDDRFGLKALVDSSNDQHQSVLQNDQKMVDLNEAVDRSKQIMSEVLEPIKNAENSTVGERLVVDQELRVFISTSIPEKKLKSLLEQGAKHNAAFYVRGLVGRSFDSTISYFRKLGAGMKPQPNVVIDSKMFKAHKVTSVPTMLYVQEDKLVYAKGFADPAYFLEKAKASDQMYLSNLSSVYKIKERDLIEEIQSRVAALNPDEIKKKALEGYWKNQVFQTLTTTGVNRYRELDMTVEVTRDIKGAGGKYIAKRGQRINILQTMGFPGRVIVFDGTKPDQVEFVKHLIPTLNNENIVMVTTEYEREDGWKKASDLEVNVGYPVYQLHQNMQERFKLEHVPSLVYPSGNYIAVQEFSEDTVVKTNEMNLVMMEGENERFPIQ